MGKKKLKKQNLPYKKQAESSKLSSLLKLFDNRKKKLQEPTAKSRTFSFNERFLALKERIFRHYDTCCYLILAIVPVIVFYSQEWLTHNPWTTMYMGIQLWNILLYELLFWGLFFLLEHARVSLSIGTIFCAICGYANYFVMAFRSAPIVPWDFYSIKTAASVAGEYDYTLEPHALVVLLVFVLVLTLCQFCRLKLDRRLLAIRLGAAALILLLGCGYVHLLHQDDFIEAMELDNTLFTPQVMARKNGFFVSFLMDLRYLNVDAPEGYDPEEVESYLAGYEEEELESQAPDIIVIMDEAFSDPAVLGDFTTNIDYMPFLHSLQNDDDENTLTGWLNVSVKGGNTANTEYEFLTSGSMRFLPAGSIPYQQYIFDDKDSLPSWLNSLGYESTSIHPFNSTGWNRDQVYEYFGFDNILFNGNFYEPERIRKFISDAACFDRILEQLEDRETEDTPQFVFAVTMQNHSGYSEEFDNFTPDVEVEGAAENCLLDRYLSLIKISDQALENFLEELSYSPRPTIVVFFGDHQPNDWVVSPIYTINGGSVDDTTEEEKALQYKVPYLIWANYEMNLDAYDESFEETSAGYLGLLTMELADLPLSSYQQAVAELQEEMPVISTQRLVNAAGEDITSLEGDSYDALKDTADLYNRLQYYMMFDKEVER